MIVLSLVRALWTRFLEGPPPEPRAVCCRCGFDVPEEDARSHGWKLVRTIGDRPFAWACWECNRETADRAWAGW